MRRLTIFVDDGGVMNDNRLRAPQWRRLLGDFFPPRLGGSAEGWAEANRVYTEGLWNTGRTWADYSSELWQQGGESYEGFHRLHQIMWLHGMCRLLDLPLPPDDEAVALADAANAYITPRVQAAPPGVVEALQALKDDGYTLHTASGERSCDLDGYLTGMGVRECFGRLYGSDLVDCLKDGPEYYRRILADSGVAPSDAVFVDDQLAVVDWIREVGACSILVGPAVGAKGHAAWLTLNSLADVPEALRCA
ncbi:MAG: HAD-IA family hydrolase [Anaerolineae bacterium]